MALAYMLRTRDFQPDEIQIFDIEGQEVDDYRMGMTRFILNMKTFDVVQETAAESALDWHPLALVVAFGILGRLWLLNLIVEFLFPRQDEKFVPREYSYLASVLTSPSCCQPASDGGAPDLSEETAQARLVA